MISLAENISSTSPVKVVNKSKQTDEAAPRSKSYDQLLRKLVEQKAEVGVIGLGYVGLPLSMAFVQGGYHVTGFDKDPRKVKQLMKGHSYIQDVPGSDVSKSVDAKNFEAYDNFAGLGNCDVIVVCVPTPLSKTKDPDMSYILSALEDISKNLRAGQLVILESTTYPGTTREVLLPQLEKSGLKCGDEFFLAFSPERVDPGNETYTVFNTPKVVGGISDSCGDLACLFYSKVMETVVRVSSPECAEMVKLLENTFRAVNIGLVNEVAIMSEKLHVDCWEVIEAASTKPFGYMPFYPGPGLGGHCIPVDPSYLSWKLRALNYTARFIELANNVNTSMPDFCVEKIANALNESERPVKGSKILICGVSYKKNIDDMRESPAIDMIHLLKGRGAKVDYYDPWVPTIDHDGLSMKSETWSDDLGSNYDVVVIATDHTNVDYEALLASSNSIVDTRNALKDHHSPKIHKL